MEDYRQEAIGFIQARADGGNSKSGGLWLNSGCYLKVNLTRVIDGWDMGYEKELNDASAVCSLSNWTGVAIK